MDDSRAFQGMWRRLLIAQPRMPVDTHTYVTWLQGPEFFGDLRQPVGALAGVQASCLAELRAEEARLLAVQAAFAGSFVVTGDEAEWVRAIDFHPPALLRDRGRIVSEGDLLIEYGVETEYVEYWQRGPTAPNARYAAARLCSVEDERAAYIVQCGRHFLYARDRSVRLNRGDDLTGLLDGADADTARALIDCEISIGAITAEGWRIDRSTLPWRAGALLLEADADLSGATLAVMDMDVNGRPTIRRLEAIDRRGAFAPVPAALAHPIPATKPRRPSATPFQSVPVIDISAIDSGDETAERAVVALLRDAASEVGFLHVTGHGIAPAVIARLRAATGSLFDLPLDEKMRSYIGNSPNHRGYVPEGEEVFAEGGKDRKEAFDLSFDLSHEAISLRRPMLGPNQWPALPGFREDIMAYYAAAFAVGRRLLHGFAMALGRPADAFDHLVTTPPSQLRLIHYPYSPDAVDVQGIGAHTDYECFTVLLATAAGLEVMNRAGEWIDAPPVPDALVVNIGDMMEYWSGGAFVATSHRVRKVAEERYSFPLFFALDYDAAIRPLGASASTPMLRTGDHLYAQTVQTFRYLQARLERGEIAMPQEARPLSSFGQEVRHRTLAVA